MKFKAGDEVWYKSGSSKERATVIEYSASGNRVRIKRSSNFGGQYVMENKLSLFVEDLNSDDIAYIEERAKA